jgi:hypothetical protein
MHGFVARLQHWWSHASPSGYRPGSLMGRLRGDLGVLECQPLGDSCTRFRAADRKLEFQAEERVEAQFLMHVVTTEFSCLFPGSAPGHNRLAIRHSGAWKRTGIVCSAPGTGDEAARSLASQLSNDADLARVLLPLDFTHFELLQDHLGWRARVVHFGACEVVYRVPPIRQYVRLAPAQLDALLATFDVLKRLLAPIVPPASLSPEKH